jgi:hypothetical protein
MNIKPAYAFGSPEDLKPSSAAAESRHDANNRTPARMFERFESSGEPNA